MRKHSVIGVLLASLGLVLGLTGSAQAGSATVWGCKSGNVCVYYYTSIPSKEVPTYQTPGNFTKTLRAQRILNNGNSMNVSFSGTYGGGHSFQGCIPRNTRTDTPSSSSYVPLSAHLGNDAWVTQAWWVSSCDKPRLQVHRVWQDTNPYWVTILN